jgi:hypothetical protein
VRSSRCSAGALSLAQKAGAVGGRRGYASESGSGEYDCVVIGGGTSISFLLSSSFFLSFFVDPSFIYLICLAFYHRLHKAGLIRFSH